MLTKEQRDEIMRLVVQHTEHAHRWATQNPQHEVAAMADLVAYLDSITAPEGWQMVPVEPTRKMLEAAIYDTSQDNGPDDCDATIGNYQAMLATAPKPGDSNE